MNAKSRQELAAGNINVNDLVALEPLKKQSLDRAAAESLRAAIISGSLLQGSRLTEASLAERFSLSRGTVRAALQRLVAEGLVVQRPYSGWDVVKLTLTDVHELSELRSGLEALAARLAAERIDPSGKKSIQAAFEALKATARADRVDELVAADMALHRTIVFLSRNKRLLDHYEMIANQVRLYIASSTRAVEGMTTVVARHKEMIEPILKGAPIEAEAAARTHSMRSVVEIEAHLGRAQLTRQAANGRPPPVKLRK